MRHLTLLCLLTLCLPLVVMSQKGETQVKPRYVLLPPEFSLLTVASQPSCPLQLENARLLYNIDAEGNSNRISYGYEFRNKGEKPIVDFSVVAWTNYGTGGTLTNEWGSKGAQLLPGQAVTYSEDENRRIVPLTEGLREKLKLNGPLRGITTLIVVRVYFADGSVYQDDKVSNALLKSLEFWEAHPGEIPEQ